MRPSKSIVLVHASSAQEPAPTNPSLNPATVNLAHGIQGCKRPTCLVKFIHSKFLNGINQKLFTIRSFESDGLGGLTGTGPLINPLSCLLVLQLASITYSLQMCSLHPLCCLYSNISSHWISPTNGA